MKVFNLHKEQRLIRFSYREQKIVDTHFTVKIITFRYQGMEGHIERSVMDVIHEQLNRRQGPDNITRNFLKFLTNACGLVEVSTLLYLRSLEPF